jgi:hypothetical protein
LVSFPRLGGIGRPEVFDLHLSRLPGLQKRCDFTITT